MTLDNSVDFTNLDMVLLASTMSTAWFMVGLDKFLAMECSIFVTDGWELL
jgi:hypothetical protein